MTYYFIDYITHFKINQQSKGALLNIKRHGFYRAEYICTDLQHHYKRAGADKQASYERLCGKILVQKNKCQNQRYYHAELVYGHHL